MAYSQQVRVKKIGFIDGMVRTASKQYVARLLIKVWPKYGTLNRIGHYSQ